jgi:hypothetical protein
MDTNLNLRPWARRARRHAIQVVALGNLLGREAFGIGPAFRLALLDLNDCASADRAQCGIPPHARPKGPLTVGAVLRQYTDRLLAEQHLSPLTDEEILAADADLDAVHLIKVPVRGDA